MNQEFKEIFASLRRTLELIGQSEKIVLLGITLLMVVTGVLTNLPALILGKLVDQMVTDTSLHFSFAFPFIGAIIFIILFREALNVVRKYYIHHIMTQAEKKQTVETINHILKADINFLANTQIGSLHGRLFRSIKGLREMIKLCFLDFFPIVFSALAAVVIALSQKPILASIMILVIPCGLYIIFRQISSQKGIRVALLRGKEKVDGTFVEMLGGLETIRSLNTSNVEVKKVEKVAEELRKKEIRHHLQMALFDSAKYLNEGFFYILVISLSIVFSVQGIISRGDILVYSILFLSITNPLREIHRILDHAHEASINVNDLYHLKQLPQDISYLPTPTDLGQTESRDIIEITDLSFAYPGTTKKLLTNINLKIKAGEKIGIAGVSGGGKSTMVKILLRLIHSYEGQVKLLGEDLQTLNRKIIAEKIAYVPQKTYLFSGSIKENILYGTSRDVREEDLVAVTKLANIYDEIITDLGGFEGIINEGGGNLSGGQRQRIAIARLILKAPEIFIFDEATSALDNSNEAKIAHNLEYIFKDKTMLIIAHRLTTLRNCDRILVFDKGRIAQEGSYFELSQQAGLFQDFLKEAQKI